MYSLGNYECIATSCCLLTLNAHTNSLYWANHEDLLLSSVKQRKVKEQHQQLIQELQQERRRRQLLQLSWASLENTLKLSFPPPADARCHFVFTARSSLFEVCVRIILNFARDFYCYAPLGLVVFAAQSADAHHSFFLDTTQRDMREWIRRKVVKALNVDMSCVRSLLEVV